MFYLAVFIFFSLPFAINNKISIFSILIVLISILLLFIYSKFNIKIQRTVTNYLFATFVVASIILVPFSLLVVRSVSSLIWILSYFVIFLLCQVIVTNEVKILNFSKILVALTALFGTFSLSNFISIGLTSYTRLDGIIGTHNVYGGFLIIPFLLSIYLLLEEKGKWQKRLWYICATIIFTSLFLNFSYLAWLSILIALILSSILFWNNIKTKLQSSKLSPILNVALITIVLTFVLFCSLWYMARQTTLDRANIPQSIELYAQKQAEEGSLGARLTFAGDAWNLFTHAPIIGFGSGMYADTLRMFKTDTIHNSFADPHSWILKMLAENGLIVTIIYILLIGSLFVEMTNMIRKRKEFSWLAIIIFTGLIGSTIHAFVDSDWSINQLLLIFYIFAGCLYGYLFNTKKKDEKNTQYFPSWVSYILLVIIIISTIVSIQFLRADLARERGDILYNTVLDKDIVINNYFQSITYNSHEPQTWYNLWHVYYSMNKFEQAENSIQKALEIFPESGIYWGALARTEEMLGEKENYRSSLIKAIKYFPASDLNYYVKLVKYDFEQKKYDEALTYINQIIPIYSKYEKSLWYKNDPNWPVMSSNLVILKDFKKKIGEVR